MFNLDIPDTLLCARRLVAAKSYDVGTIEIDQHGLSRPQDARQIHISVSIISDGVRRHYAVLQANQFSTLLKVDGGAASG